MGVKYNKLIKKKNNKKKQIFLLLVKNKNKYLI